MNATATATKSRSKKVVPPTFSAPIAEVHLVPIELIDVQEQIRKEFDEEALGDLARDIEARGLIQPVILNPDPNTGRFTMIAGERRLRATVLNGQTAIPALLTKASAQEAMLMQLAENVQREDLSLTEECEAVCKLYEILGSLKEVAAVVKKSVPWCSKRFAAKNGKGLHWKAHEILEEGVSEDIDLLKSLSALFELVPYSEIQEWDSKVRTGQAGRAEVRDALKARKEEIKKEKTAEKAEEKAAVSHAKVKTPPPPPEWNIEDALEELEEALSNLNREKDAIDIYQAWTDEQQILVTRKLGRLLDMGRGEGSMREIARIVFRGSWDTKVSDLEVLAMIYGQSGKPFTTRDFLSDLQQYKVTA